ncbi:MAG: PAS domain S-box protein [Cyanobacteria bacterium P01_A01_bin.114]
MSTAAEYLAQIQRIEQANHRLQRQLEQAQRDRRHLQATNQKKECLLNQTIQELNQAERQLQSLIAGTAASTGKAFFPALVRHIAEALNVSCAIVTEAVDEVLHPLAVWVNGALQPHVPFTFEKTPCEYVLKNGEFFCESAVQQRFPEDLDLAEMVAESYLGIALRNTQGAVMGSLCILDQQPIQNQQRATQILRVFAARAAAELERQRATTALEKLNQALEAQVAARTAALREREQFLQTVLDTFPLSVFWKDRELVYRGGNCNFSRDAGLSSVANIVGQTDYDLPWGADEAEAYRADDRQVMATNQAKLGIIETQIQAGGKQIWLETNKLPLHSLTGKVVGVLGTYRDITDRKQAEEALRESEARWQFALEGSGYGVWDWNLQTNTVFFSQQLKAMLGYAEDEMANCLDDWTSRIHPDDKDQVFADVNRYFSGETATYQNEHRLRCKNGSYIWIVDRGKVVERTAEGQPLRMIGTHTDITALKQAQSELQALNQQLEAKVEKRTAALQERETRYRALMDRASDAILLVDQQGNVLEANRRAEELLGYPQANLTAMHLTQLHRSDELTRIMKAFEALAHDQPFAQVLDVHFCCKAGHSVPVDISASVIEVHGEKIIQEIFRDISDRKQTEAQLRKTNQELARATRLKDEFLANMSHELRTPLNTVLGMSEALQEQTFGPVTSGQSKALQTIEHSGAHLLELINDILDVAKIEAGQMTLHRAPTAVALLCQSSLAFIKQPALRKRIQLQVKPLTYLPDVWVDERRIRQVLINLLDNAVKFTPEGGQITLDVSCQQRPAADAPSASEPAVPTTYLRIAVIDTGIGIAPDHIDSLFQPFVQIDSALNRQYTGTGLGLVLVKCIVELHGGQVEITSQVGVGSCVTIELPCTDSLAAVTTVQPPIDSGPACPQPSRPLIAPLILLAEDNEANISTFSSYLSAKGYRLRVAKNGQTAIALAQSEAPDLILMDIQMPEVDGLEAIRQIRHTPNLTDTPIIALTALAMPGDLGRCLAAGANDYLSKPVKLKQLATKIQQLLSRGVESKGE